MSDKIATIQRAVDNSSDEMAASPLSARIAHLNGQANANALPAAQTTSATIMERADQRGRRSRSIIGMTVRSFVSVCSFIPYALVALALRLVMARVFFLDGQSRVEGLRVPLNVQDFSFPMVLPLQVKIETIGTFISHATLPVSPVVIAYLVSYAEFILPICLVLGFATRFSALGMLIITALFQFYVTPEALWTVHIYWASILLVLLSRGAGQISVDQIIRVIARR